MWSDAHKLIDWCSDVLCGQVRWSADWPSLLIVFLASVCWTTSCTFCDVETAIRSRSTPWSVPLRGSLSSTVCHCRVSTATTGTTWPHPTHVDLSTFPTSVWIASSKSTRPTARSPCGRCPVPLAACRWHRTVISSLLSTRPENLERWWSSMERGIVCARWFLGRTFYGRGTPFRWSPPSLVVSLSSVTVITISTTTACHWWNLVMAGNPAATGEVPASARAGCAFRIIWRLMRMDLWWLPTTTTVE